MDITKIRYSERLAKQLAARKAERAREAAMGAAAFVRELSEWEQARRARDKAQALATRAAYTAYLRKKFGPT